MNGRNAAAAAAAAAAAPVDGGNHHPARIVRANQQQQQETTTRDPLTEVANFLNQFGSRFLLPSMAENRGSGSGKNNNSNGKNNNNNNNNNNKNDNSNDNGGTHRNESSNERERAGSGSGVLGEITPEDLDAALKLGKLLDRSSALEMDVFVAEQYERNGEGLEALTRAIVDRKTRELERLTEQIERGVPERARLVLAVLGRCQVWLCKFVAQDHLVFPTRWVPDASKNKTKHCCFSPLLNLPCSGYFANLLPPIDLDADADANVREATTNTNTNDTGTATASREETAGTVFHRTKGLKECCSLALPPNKHTWEAYAGLARIASLIGDEELAMDDGERDNNNNSSSNKNGTTSSSNSSNNNTNTNNTAPAGAAKNPRESAAIRCLKSPLCVHDLSKHRGRNPSHHPQYSFAPVADFVPLWMRARRNTQARRQLTLLFRVERNRNEGDENEAENENERRAQSASRDSTEDGPNPNINSAAAAAAAAARIDPGNAGGSGNRRQDTASAAPAPAAPAPMGGGGGEPDEAGDRGRHNKNNDKKRKRRRRRFEATLEGNPLHIRIQMSEVSELVDQLVEWAVVNQAMFTYRHVKTRILSAPLRRRQQKQQEREQERQQTNCGRKRPRNGGIPNGSDPSKKVRGGGDEEHDDDNDNDGTRERTNRRRKSLELYRACQSYLLRWFARRNRKAVSMILLSKRNRDLSPLDIGCLADADGDANGERWSAGDAESVLPALKEGLRKISTDVFHPEDRSLSRIDRRLSIRGRYDGGGGAAATPIITCESQVSVLLETLRSVVPDAERSPISEAIEDLGRLFGEFSPEPFGASSRDDVLRMASRLVDPSSNAGGASASTSTSTSARITNESDLADLLGSAPLPWAEVCSVCKRPGSDDDGGGSNALRTCFNCERVFHEDCAVSSGCDSRPTVRNLTDLVRSFPPLREIFALKHPDRPKRPDFLAEETEWPTKTLRIHREKDGDGGLEKLGLSYYNTEECVEFFDAVESDALSVLELAPVEERVGGIRDAVVPARIARKGWLVTCVEKGLCAGRAGVEVGDIIVGVEREPSDFDGGDGDDTLRPYHGASGEGGSKTLDMSALSNEDRVALLTESVDMNLVVLRPPLNVVELGATWYAAVKEENRTALNVLSSIRGAELWYCGKCSKPNAAARDESESVFSEAAHCRAVIRRLGMESYSEPFREEIREGGGGESVADHVCLRRLDAIMTHIMRIESGGDDSRDDATDSFLAPPSADPTRRRLSWATESLRRQPMALLCAAMKNLMNAAFPIAGGIHRNRDALLRHFVLSFGSWCVAATVKSSSFHRMAGPPDIFRYCRAPWMKPSCSVCFSRPADDTTTCENRDCVDYANRDERVKFIDEAEAERTRSAMEEYSMHASLVGTSFLVLPSDPLVDCVSKVVPIDSESRPIEFIVASYLPSEYQDEVLKGRQKDHHDQFGENDGVYHLIPVVSSRQQLFLLERCKVRNDNENAVRSGFSWTSLDVLNFEGIARYSPTALKGKLEESNEIRLAIDDAIIQHVFKSSVPFSHHCLPFESPSESEIVMDSHSSKSREGAVKILNDLIDTLLKGNASAAVLRELSSSQTCEDRITEGENEEDRSNWKIIQRQEGTDALEFGLSRLQPGLVPINAIKSSCQILTIPHISEQMYMLYYSDLYFHNEEGKRDLIKTLEPPNIVPFHGPRFVSHEVKKHVILAKQHSSENDSNSFGWGFEIVRWRNERFLRVGRVRRGSPAFRVGLRTHDILESVNGIRYSHFSGISALVASILGAPNIKIRLPECPGRNNEISTILSTIKDAKLKLSPVAVSISRPTLVQIQSIRSERSVPEPSSRPATVSEPPRISVSKPLSQPATATERSRKNLVGPPVPVHVNHRTNHNQTSGTNIIQNGAQETAQRTPMIIAGGQMLTDKQIAHVRKMRDLKEILRETYSDRPRLQKSDFYRPARNGVILTALEASVFLESVYEGTWKLGLRLLMPRYDAKTLLSEAKTVFSWTRETFLKIPVIYKFCYQEVLQLDFQRMNCCQYPETGPIILREANNGQKYEYREPVRPLPIDKVIEISFESHQKLLYTQHRTGAGQFAVQNQSPPLPHQNGYNGYLPRYQQQGTYEDPRREQLHPHSNGNHVRMVRPSTSNSPVNREPRIHQSKAVNGRPNDSGSLPQETNNGNHPTVINLTYEERHEGNMLRQFSGDPSLAIYTNETSEQMGNRNSEHSHLPYSTTTVQNHPTQRIRGGGDDAVGEPIQYLYLCDVPPSQWTGKAVYTFVQTSSEGSISHDALLVGFVKRYVAPDTRNEATQYKVEIEAYYLSGTGYFENSKIHESESDVVWIVDIEQDSEESRVIAKLRSQFKLPDEYHEESQRTLLRRNAIVPEDQEDDRYHRSQQRSSNEQEEKDQDPSPNLVSDNQRIFDRHSSMGQKGITRDWSLVDKIQLDCDQTTYTYSCEEKCTGSKTLVAPRKGSCNCSLCSLPFERYLECTTRKGESNLPETTLLQTVGCELISAKTLDNKQSCSDEEIPGLLGEGKKLLLKIARLIPESIQIDTDYRNKDVDPLNSNRVFNSDVNYRIWKTFVRESNSTQMLAQALVVLIASIRRSKLPPWWSHRCGGWSTPYTLMTQMNVSTLYLHIYVLDAALSDRISGLLRETPRQSQPDDANATQQLRMKKYWKRAMSLGYEPFDGANNEECYHCDDGGTLLCCELCPNVQHHDCCDPKMSLDVKLDHWICDSCINDIDNFDDDNDFEDYQDEISD